MQSEQDEFARFLTTREQAAIAFVNGDADLLNGLEANDLPVSFFEKAGPEHYNSVAVFDADGRNLGVYRKTHLFPAPILAGPAAPARPKSGCTTLSYTKILSQFTITIVYATK